MGDLEIDVAGRRYSVAVADGQEAALAEAGARLSAQAEALRERAGDRFPALPEARVLLLAGLMAVDAARGDPAAATQAPEPEPEDPAAAAHLADLEARLAEAEAAEAVALAALDDAAARIRAMAAELAEAEAHPDDSPDADDLPDAAPPPPGQGAA